MARRASDAIGADDAHHLLAITKPQFGGGLAIAYAEGAADENEYGVNIPAEIDVKAIRGRPSMTSRPPTSGVRAKPAADVFKWRGNGGERRSHFCSRVAERVGFEPTVRLRAHLISSQARSTTPAPLRASDPRVGPGILVLRQALVKAKRPSVDAIMPARRGSISEPQKSKKTIISEGCVCAFCSSCRWRR